MKGKILKMWENKLNVSRAYTTLSIDGERYNVWAKKYDGKFKEGDVVNYDFEVSGKYKNIKSISRVENPAAGDGETNAPGARIIDPLLRKNKEIVRMSCLKTASYAMQDQIDMTPEEKTDKIIALAKKLENYVSDFDDSQKDPDETPAEFKKKQKDR